MILSLLSLSSLLKYRTEDLLDIANILGLDRVLCKLIAEGGSSLVLDHGKVVLKRISGQMNCITHKQGLCTCYCLNYAVLESVEPQIFEPFAKHYFVAANWVFEPKVVFLALWECFQSYVLVILLWMNLH